VAAGGLVEEEAERAVLGEDHDVDPAVVVEITDGEVAGDARDRPGLTGRLRDVGQAAVLATDH